MRFRYFIVKNGDGSFWGTAPSNPSTCLTYTGLPTSWFSPSCGLLPAKFCAAINEWIVDKNGQLLSLLCRLTCRPNYPDHPQFIDILSFLLQIFTHPSFPPSPYNVALFYGYQLLNFHLKILVIGLKPWLIFCWFST